MIGGLLCGVFIASSLILGGCGATQKDYSAPLHEMNILGDDTGGSWHIEEISGERLAHITPGERPPIDSDEAGYWMAMDKAEERYKTSGNRIRNDRLEGYLKDVTCGISPEYCGDIRIYVMRMPYFNASMAPNGALVVWSGLLLRARNEAQIASVLGHEIGHYLRRHSLQQMRGAIKTTNALAFVKLVTVAAGVGFAGDIAYLVGAGGLQSYSRDMEREADGYGLALMTRAGYDPREGGKLWRQVIREEEAGGDKTFSTLIFDSHPPEKERLAAMDDLAGRIVAKGGDFVVARDSYEEILDQHITSFLRDELHLRNFARFEVLLDALAEGGAESGRVAYFRGELYRLRNREGDRGKAISAYEEATAFDDCPSDAYRGLGLLHREEGRMEKARGYLRKYLEKDPLAVDREIITDILSRMEK